MGPGIEHPAYSKLTESSTGYNTATSSGVKSANDRFCSTDRRYYASHTASGRPKNLERPYFGHGDVTPFSSRTDVLPTSLQNAKTTHDASCGDYIVPFLGDVYSSYDDITLSKDFMLSCPAATSSELCQDKCEIAYLAVPIQDVHATDPDTHDYLSVNPTQRVRHSAGEPQTGCYKSAIPRLKSIYSKRIVRQRHFRGAVKHNAPETKPLDPIIGDIVYSQTRTILPPQVRQQTFKEHIDRRRGRKENVSSKVLQQVGVEIDRPDSGLEETLLVYQAWVHMGRGGRKSSAGIMSSNSDRDGRSTWSKVGHDKAGAPRLGSGKQSNRSHDTKQRTDHHNENFHQGKSKCHAKNRWSSTDADSCFVKADRHRLCVGDIGNEKRGSRTQSLIPASPQENTRNRSRSSHTERARNCAYADMANISPYVTSHVTSADPKATRNGTHIDRRRNRSNGEGEQHDSATRRSKIPITINRRLDISINSP